MATVVEHRREEAAQPVGEREVAVRNPWWNRPLLVLSMLTLLGGALRFTRLAHPPLWGDEALTASRVVGTYEQMLQILKNDGFAPLHYTLYWLIGQVVPLSPAMMRIVPAIAGTLMIPAMYFLVVQLYSRKAALTAAAFCACSAYLLVYSRDGKMYAPVWMLSVLNLGCFLWWIRTRKWTAWAAWIAAGAVAGMYSPIALVVLLVELTYLPIAERARWLNLPLFLLGIALIGAGPAIYYMSFNRWLARSGALAPGVTQQGRSNNDWHYTGIAWVDEWTAGRPASELTYHTITGYMYGFSRFKETEDAEQRMPPGVAGVTTALPWVFGGLAMLGLFPWRARSRQMPGKLPDNPLKGRSGSYWRRATFVSLWLVLPWYGIFYCRSIDHFQPPIVIVEFFRGRLALVAGIVAISAICFWYCGRSRRERLSKLAETLLVVGIVYGATHGVYLIWSYLWARASAANPGLDWKSLWFPRYIGVLTPAVGLMLVLLFLRLPTRPLRWGAIGLLLGVNLFNGVARIVVESEPRVDLMAADSYAARDDAGDVRVFTTLENPGFGSVTGNLSNIVGMYYLWHVSGKELTPQQFRRSPPSYQFPFLRHRPDFTQPAHVKKLIIWDYGDPAPSERKVPPGWRLAAEDRYPIYIWYNWQRMGEHRRRVYVRADQLQ